jgi:subtilisin family serine protease
VAVIDTGVDLNHEDLKPHLVKGFNAINPNAQPQDDHGHGTHCAGTIGGIGNNKKGVVGVCWSVKIMPCKFLGKTGSGSLFDAVMCIDFACAHGAKIMSNSWSGGGFSQALFDAINRANKRGILFVAAAGNSATDNDVTPTYPATYKLPNIVSVAAIDIADAKAGFSCFGKKTVHLSAPGVQVFSSVPKSGALGDASGYRFLSGTSMATPHVSGAAALTLGHSKYHAYKADQLKALLMKNARKIPAMSGKCVTGATLDITFLGK